MSKKKTSYLPKFEVLIILVFFASFMVWAMSECSKTKELYQDEPELTEETADEQTDTNPTAESTSTETADSTSTTTLTTAPVATPPISNNISTSSTQTRYAPLFVTIDGLKMRSGPSLDSAVIVTLKLFEQVNFMGEVTDSTQQINLGYEIADEPWVKVQHRRGKVGWVYGAGVHYHKKKRGGVLE